MVVAVVAIIVVGPKELPGMLRTVGKMFGQVRRTAREFQNTFNDALREAERQAALDDVKKDLDEVRRLDPTKDLRASVSAAQKDLNAAVGKTGPAAVGVKPGAAADAAAPAAAVTTPGAPVSTASAPAADAPAFSASAGPEPKPAVAPPAGASASDTKLPPRPAGPAAEPLPVPAEDEGAPRMAVGDRR